jgi:hypothetical protein
MKKSEIALWGGRVGKLLTVVLLVCFVSLSFLGCPQPTDDDDDDNRSTALAPPASGPGSIPSFGASTYEKFRCIATTDPELDDLNSMIHMLLYANEINLVGLVYNYSQHHYMGNGRDVANFRWPEAGEKLHIDTAVDAYEQAYPYLVQHDSNYPTPGYLRSITYMGNVNGTTVWDGTAATKPTSGNRKNGPDISLPTPGSEHIKRILLDDVDDTVFVLSWGGLATVARALKDIHDVYGGDPVVVDKINKKLVIASYGFQDNTYTTTIGPLWPDVQHRQISINPWGYGGRNSVATAEQYLMDTDWMKANVSTVGPFGPIYRVWGNGKQMASGFDDEDYFWLCDETDSTKLSALRTKLQGMGYGVWTGPLVAGGWISEGDSPSWALLVNNGLRSWENPTYGGWGGRLQKKNQGTGESAGSDMWSPAQRDNITYGSTGTTITRWWKPIMHDFATRLQWTIRGPAACNHEPTVVVTNNITNDSTLDFTVASGTSITLTAQIVDRDGDTVSLKWWQYEEADTVTTNVGIGGAGSTCTFTATGNPGETIHAIAEVTDDAALPLTSWQRVVITIATP